MYSVLHCLGSRPSAPRSGDHRKKEKLMSYLPLMQELIEEDHFKHFSAGWNYVMEY